MANFNEEDFKKCVNSSRRHGTFIIECKKGLWGVYAPSYLQAFGEASHYFMQYLEDGEYDAILKPQDK